MSKQRMLGLVIILGFCSAAFVGCRQDTATIEEQIERLTEQIAQDERQVRIKKMSLTSVEKSLTDPNLTALRDSLGRQQTAIEAEIESLKDQIQQHQSRIKELKAESKLEHEDH